MLDEVQLWNFFNSVKPFIKFSYYCDYIGLNRASFSRYLKHKAYTMVSLNDLLLIYDLIQDDFNAEINKKLQETKMYKQLIERKLESQDVNEIEIAQCHY